MPDSIPQFPGGFPPMGGGFPPMQGDFRVPGGFPDMGGFGGGNMLSWFAAYRVSSYEEEIAMLKKWFADRLAFLDSNIDRFDKDWEPRIQELRENSMPQFGSPFPFTPF